MQFSPQERLLLLEQALKFFFEAMRHGWASGEAQFVTMEHTWGKEKFWPYTNPDFKNFAFEDRYRIYKDSKMSDGRKVITYFDRPIWFMDYGGWYDKEVIAFLKEALMDAYNENVFYGGRGRSSFYIEGGPHNGLQYVNKGDLEDFRAFRGKESATDPFGKLRGTHDYFGGLLI